MRSITNASVWELLPESLCAGVLPDMTMGCPVSADVAVGTMVRTRESVREGEREQSRRGGCKEAKTGELDGGIEKDGGRGEVWRSKRAKKGRSAVR